MWLTHSLFFCLAEGLRVSSDMHWLCEGVNAQAVVGDLGDFVPGEAGQVFDRPLELGVSAQLVTIESQYLL